MSDNLLFDPSAHSIFSEIFQASSDVFSLDGGIGRVEPGLEQPAQPARIWERLTVFIIDPPEGLIPGGGLADQIGHGVCDVPGKSNDAQIWFFLAFYRLTQQSWRVFNDGFDEQMKDQL